jgi:hypothetical protein
MFRYLQACTRSLFLFALIFSPLAFASGSYSTGGGDQANQAYNVGKATFYKKLICSSCPLAGLDPDASKAAELVSQLPNKPDFAQKLSDQERDGVIQYLQRRYDLN